MKHLLRCYCHECCAQISQEWYKAKRDRGEPLPSRAGIFRAYDRKQQHAGYQASYALATGKLAKQPCVICGAPESQMHHENYNKPLEVVWLCQKHHKAVHRKYHPLELQCVEGSL